MKPKQKIKEVIPKEVKHIEKTYIDILNKYTFSPKQRLFILYYFENGFNGSQAVKSAGYKVKATHVQASKLLVKPNIYSCVAEIKGKIEQKAEIELDLSVERVLLEWKRLAFANTIGLFNKDGSLKKIHEIDEELSPAISDVHVRNNLSDDGGSSVIFKFKLADKTKALDALGKYLGMYEKDNKQKGEVTKEARHAVIEELLGGIAAQMTTLPPPREEKDSK
jgi:phage terminase small subunit